MNTVGRMMFMMTIKKTAGLGTAGSKECLNMTEGVIIDIIQENIFHTITTGIIHLAMNLHHTTDIMRHIIGQTLETEIRTFHIRRLRPIVITTHRMSI